MGQASIVPVRATKPDPLLQGFYVRWVCPVVLAQRIFEVMSAAAHNLSVKASELLLRVANSVSGAIKCKQ
jgi:hypothetical protein